MRTTIAVIGATILSAIAIGATAAATPLLRTTEKTLAGKTIVQWHQLAVHRRIERDKARTRVGVLTRQMHQARYRLVHQPSSLEAIRLASITYGQSYADLVRVASCETGGDFNPYSKNPSSSASGLFQFLTGTWAGTPFGRESIWSPYANALAAGWMWSHGRKNEWVCR